MTQLFEFLKYSQIFLKNAPFLQQIQTIKDKTMAQLKQTLTTLSAEEQNIVAAIEKELSKVIEQQIQLILSEKQNPGAGKLGENCRQVEDNECSIILEQKCSETVGEQCVEEMVEECDMMDEEDCKLIQDEVCQFVNDVEVSLDCKDPDCQGEIFLMILLNLGQFVYCLSILCLHFVIFSI